MAKKQINILCDRVKMCEGGTSYHVYVELKSLPKAIRAHMSHIVVNEGKEYVNLVSGLAPLEHLETRPGIERWDNYRQMEPKANELAVNLLKQAFPEANAFCCLPSLWIDDTYPSQSVTLQIPYQTL